jgi:LysR family nitrogen assimilation transcriptional regulator
LAGSIGWENGSPNLMEARMNLRRLKYFVKIVDIGSLTQAAEVLHIAQPALSQQLATLEGELQQQLLIRTKRGVVPTDAGNILYSHAQTILRQCEVAQQAVNRVGNLLSGQVCVGLTPGLAGSLLAVPMLKAVREQHPGIVLYLDESIGVGCTELLSNGRMDMAVLYDSKNYPGLSVTPLLQEDLYLVGSSALENPGKYVDLSDVTKFGLLLPRAHHVLRKVINEATELRRLPLNVISEIESSSTLSAAVAQGVGVTILPESSARMLASSHHVWLSRINTPSLHIPLSLYHRDHLTLSQSAQAVKKIIMSLMTPSSENIRPLLAVG